MHLILNDGSGILMNTKSKRKILIKAALVYKLHWVSRKKRVAACCPECMVCCPECTVCCPECSVCCPECAVCCPECSVCCPECTVCCPECTVCSFTKLLSQFLFKMAAWHQERCSALRLSVSTCPSVALETEQCWSR